MGKLRAALKILQKVFWSLWNMQISIVIQTFASYWLSPIGSTGAERAISGIRRLKTPYRNTMSDEREGDLTLIQLQKLAEIDDNEVIKVFIQLHPRRLFTEHLLRLWMEVKITFSFYLLKRSHLDMINLVVDFVIYKDVLNKKYYIICIKNI